MQRGKNEMSFALCASVVGGLTCKCLVWYPGGSHHWASVSGWPRERRGVLALSGRVTTRSAGRCTLGNSATDVVPARWRASTPRACCAGHANQALQQQVYRARRQWYSRALATSFTRPDAPGLFCLGPYQERGVRVPTCY